MIPFLFGGVTDPTVGAKPPLLLYNTLTRTKERFEPIHADSVRMYNCGPTVYDYAHIGNLRSYVFADTLRRILALNGYKVMQVINITDIGHLASDADDGDDKMTLALKREGKPMTLTAMKEVADFYTAAYLEDLAAMNIKQPNALPRASEHIKADIALIETLMQKEYAYRTSDGVYFDTARFAGYGKLGSIDLEAQQAGARVAQNEEKRNPSDFALWKRNDAMGWESPWGRGFPGWHIECSAMAMEYLGKELDIHTGGIDHIGTHHNNEIAQSEAATGRPFARIWMHNAHVLIEGAKLSKSLGNTIKLRQLKEHGFSPLAYRYWLLTASYRTQMNFSFSTLEGAQTALRRLHRFFVENLADISSGEKDAAYAERFLLACNNDLDTPAALALTWELIKDSEIPIDIKRATLLYFDRALGIGLTELAVSEKARVALTVKTESFEDLPQDIRALIERREDARKENAWSRADECRHELEKRGYTITDTSNGPKIGRLN